MLKKIIKILLILILLAILSLIIIFVFNPINLRTKIISYAINSYLGYNIKDYQPLDNHNNQTVVPVSTNSNDKNPLLNAEQEKTLEKLGVDVTKLPTEITPAIQNCAIDILGEKRAMELANGDTPTALEVIKAGKCLGQ